MFEEADPLEATWRSQRFASSRLQMRIRVDERKANGAAEVAHQVEKAGRVLDFLRRHGAQEGSNVAGKPALRDLQPCQEKGSAPHIRR